MGLRGWREIGGWSSCLRRLRPSRHLTERELALVAVEDGRKTDPIMAAITTHLAVCPDCAVKRSDTRGLLARIADEAEAAFDAETPSHRFARQRRRILRRVGTAFGSGPARILLFPASAPRAARRASSAPRWLAATAAAGLLLSLALVQPGDVPRSESNGTRPGESVASAENRALATTGEPASERGLASQTDEELMRDLEAALATWRVEPLMALDEMTPRLRAASIDVR